MMHAFTATRRWSVKPWRGLFRRCIGTTHTTVPVLREPFKILFCGRDEFSTGVFEELYAARDVWQGIWIATYPDRKTGRDGKQVAVSPLRCLGESLDIPVHYIPPDKRAFKTWQPPSPFSPVVLTSPPPSHLIITASFGRILPPSLLSLVPTTQRLNVHPSLLPSYRGAAPIQHALIRGEKETGVCVIGMAERKMGIDSGDVWGMRRFDILEDSTTSSLRTMLAREGGQLLVEVLRDMLAGKARAAPQHSVPSAPLAPSITPHDAVLDFGTMTAEEIVRRYRAISHQKSVKAYLPNYKSLQIHSPAVFTLSSSTSLDVDLELGEGTYHPPTASLLISCSGGAYLLVPKVKEQDRRLLSSKEWWNGVRPELCSTPRNEQDHKGSKTIKFLGKEEVWERVGFLSRGNVWEKARFMESVGAGKREQ